MNGKITKNYLRYSSINKEVFDKTMHISCNSMYQYILSYTDTYMSMTSYSFRYNNQLMI